MLWLGVRKGIAFFFLLSVVLDIWHPCAEKLEAIGLLDDRVLLTVGDLPRSDLLGKSEEPASKDTWAGDDDCFCCRPNIFTYQANLLLQPVKDGSPLAPFDPSKTETFVFSVEHPPRHARQSLPVS